MRDTNSSSMEYKNREEVLGFLYEERNKMRDGRLKFQNLTLDFWNNRLITNTFFSSTILIFIFWLPAVIGKTTDSKSVESLIAALKDKDTNVRASAAEALGEMEDTFAVESLIAALKDNDSAVRVRAAKALGQIGDIRAFEPLIIVLKDKDNAWYVRSTAVAALGHIGNIKAIDPLVTALKDNHARVRSNAAETLDKLDWKAKDEEEKVSYLIAKQNWDECVKIGNPAVEPLIAVLLQDGDGSVRNNAAYTLGRIGDPRAAEPLVSALKDYLWYVRGNAAEALDKINWQAKDEEEKVSYLIAKQNWDECVKIGNPAVEPLIVALKDINSDIRSTASAALGRIGNTRAVGPLVTALKDNHAHVRVNVAEALDKLSWQAEDEKEKIAYLIAKQNWFEFVRIGTPAVEPLIAMLNDNNNSVRAMTAYALGTIGDIRAVEPLIAVLKDKNDGVRSRVVYALRTIGDIRAVEPLIATLKDNDAAVRSDAAEALATIGDTRAAEPLIAALNDNDYGVRNSAAKALAIIGDTRAVKPLAAILLQDENVFVRYNAAYALGMIGDTRAVEPLVAVLNDNDVSVRRSAAEALDKLDWQAEDEKEKIAYLIAKQNWDECVKIGNPIVEPLIAALKDFNAGVRDNAAETLGRIGNTRAVEPLATALKDYDSNVRRSAAEALVQIGNPAVKPLIAVLKDDDFSVRRSAAEALVKIGNPAVRPLAAELKDANADVRRSAAEALDKLGWQAKDEQEKIVYLIAKQNWDECEKIGIPAIKPLIDVLKDDDFNVRISAERALTKIGNTAVEPLLAALNDEPLIARWHIVESLGEIGDIRAVEPLIVALDENYMGAITAKALGKIGDIRAVEPLISALKDSDEGVRRSAAEALGRIGNTKAVKPLITALKDDDTAVRNNAAEALGNIGDQTAVPVLVPLLKDWYCGKQASNALKKLHWQPENIGDKVHYAVAMRDKSFLTGIWEQTKSILLEDVLSNEYRTIENALYAFIGIGKQEIIPTLIKTLNSMGNKTMAEAYLNCGQKELDSAARTWSDRHGYTIMVGAGAAPVGWGSMR